MSTLELVADVKNILGEGPCWDHEQQLLYWVDIEAGYIYVYDIIKKKYEIAVDVHKRVGALALTENGGFIAAVENGICLIDKKGYIRKVAQTEEFPGSRLNDGKCDPAGRFWTGSLSMHNERYKGGLYCIDCDLNVRKVIDGVSVSNGLAWNPDNSVMYYIDSAENVVWSYDYSMDTGAITNRKISVSIPEDEGIPDGMTIDAEGMIWIAHWGGYKVSRWNPDTGERLTEIAVPAGQVTSCTFGGRQMDELYITSARLDLTNEELEKYPYSGGLFRIRTDFVGMNSYRFCPSFSFNTSFNGI